MSESNLPHPSLSIVTPNYNGQDYLQSCIRSVLEQNIHNLEYVIVDGASQDNSLQIINQFRPQFSKVIVEKDDGHADALNKGFAATSGDIMGWINSDDTLFDGALRFVQRLFAVHPEIEWITGRASSMNAMGEVTAIQPARPWSRLRFLSGDHAWIQQESTFWRRSLWERAGARLDDSLALANDFELWMRFFRYAELHTVDRHLGCFRVRPGQRSVLYQNRYKQEADQVIARELKGLDEEYRTAFQGTLPKRPRTLTGPEREEIEAQLAVCDVAVLKPSAVYRSARHRATQSPVTATTNIERGLTAFPAPSDLSPFRDKHCGERCFILGNGPSLNKTDLSLLEDEVVFGCNNIFLLFDKISWRPTYFTCVDALVLPDRAPDIRAMLDRNPSITGFFPVTLADHTGEKRSLNTRDLIPDRENRFFFREHPPTALPAPWSNFSPNPSAYMVQPHTVTITMLQLAAFMGFSEIYLVGCDTTYTVKRTVAQPLAANRQGRIVLTSTVDDDPNHFDSSYFGAQRQWHMPDLNAIILQYGDARRALESLNVKVFNATVGGALEVFERIDLEEAVAKEPASVRGSREPSPLPSGTTFANPRTVMLRQGWRTMSQMVSNNRLPVLATLLGVIAVGAAMFQLPTFQLKLGFLAIALAGMALGLVGMLALKSRRIILNMTTRLDAYTRAQVKLELENLELSARIDEMEFGVAPEEAEDSNPVR